MAKYPYGFWLTHKGEVLEVDYEDHYGVAEKYILKHFYKQYYQYMNLGMEGLNTPNNFVMSQLGWIRLVIETDTRLSVQFEKEAIAQKAYNAYVNFIKNSVYTEFTTDIGIISSTDGYKNYDTDDDRGAWNRMLRDIRSNVDTNKRVIEASETKGFWVNADGKIIDLSPGMTEHYEEAEKHFEGWGYIALYKALDSGWIRARTFGNTLIVTIGADSLFDKTIKTFRQYLKENYFEKIELAVHKNVNPVKYVEVEGNLKGINTIYKMLRENKFKAPVIDYDSIDSLLEELKASTKQSVLSLVERNVKSGASMNKVISFVTRQIKPTSFNIRTKVHSSVLGNEAANRIKRYTRMKNARTKVQLQSRLEAKSKIR